MLRSLLRRRKKHPETVGIHVGRGTMTVARVGSAKGKPCVLKLFSEALPRRPNEWPAKSVAAFVKKAKKAVPLQAASVTLTLASGLVRTSFLDMPCLGADQLAEAVVIELDDVWRRESDRPISHQFEILHSYPDRYRVFVASIPIARLRLILTTFADAGCKIDAMEVETVSLANLLSAAGATDSAPLAVLDIGPAWGEIHILKGDKVLLSRSVMKADGEEGPAGSPKGTTSDADSTRTAPKGAVPTTRLPWIVREAGKTLDYFEIELVAQPVERLFLMGESSQDARLPGMLRDDLSLDVELLNCGDALEDRTGDLDLPRHALAVAAALSEGAGRAN